eukprot:535048_1
MNKVEKTRNSHRKNRQKQKTGKIIRKTQTQKSKNYQIRQDTLRHTRNQDKPRRNQENTTTKLPASHFKHDTGKVQRSKQESEEVMTHQDKISTLQENEDYLLYYQVLLDQQAEQNEQGLRALQKDKDNRLIQSRQGTKKHHRIQIEL